MPINRKRLFTIHYFQLDRALQFLSPRYQARYLSSFVNELYSGYSGNKSKTHSDLNDKRENAPRPKFARQKKNKPNSGNPFPSSQCTAGQQLRRKNPYEKRGGKIKKAKPNIAIFMGNMKLHCFQLASLPSLNSGCTPKRLQDKAMAEPQDFVRGSALLG